MSQSEQSVASPPSLCCPLPWPTERALGVAKVGAGGDPHCGPSGALSVAAAPQSGWREG